MPDLATGVRAATATVLPILLSIKRPDPALLWMALGGWLGTLADPGGSRLVRARPVLAFTVIGAAVVAVGEVGAPTLPRMAMLVAATAFSGSLARALGASLSSLGTLLAIVAALAVGHPSKQPLPDVLGFVAGSALALVLSSIVWPVWTHLPVRRATASVFQALLRYAQAIDERIASGAAAETDAWTKLEGEHPRHVRDAIESARAMSLAIRARHGGESRLGGNLRLLLGMAESQFLGLVALASLVEQGDAEARLSGRHDLAALSRIYADIGAVLVARVLSSGAEPRDARGEGASPLASDLLKDGEAALGLAGSLDRATPPLSSSEASREEAALYRSVEWTTLRDALASGSPIYHHAVRVAVAAGASVVVGKLFAPRFFVWVTVTAVVVLQPDAGATVRRGAERVVGTVLGGLVAVGITALRIAPVGIVLLMFPMSVAALVTRPRSYRWFTFFLTPVFLLLAMHAPGDVSVAIERGADTLAGGALALAASILMWPRWEERVLLPEAVKTMVDAVRAYMAAVLGSLDRRDAAAVSTGEMPRPSRPSERRASVLRRRWGERRAASKGSSSTRWRAPTSRARRKS